MNIIYKHEVKIHKERSKWDNTQDSFDITEVEILGENENYIVLNDFVFSKIDKKKDGILYPSLGYASIHFKSMWGGKGIFYTLYAREKKQTRTIEKQIRDKIKKECGWLLDDELSLDILYREVK